MQARAALLAGVLLIGACSAVGRWLGGRPNPDEEPAPEPILTLHVENQNFYDATIYALAASGERQRLGVVTGNNQGTFTFRWLHQELRVVIQLLAGGSRATDRVLVSPGDTLELIIQPDLHLKIP
jgi:hypothetical protein